MTETSTPAADARAETMATLAARVAERHGGRESSRWLRDGEWRSETYAETCAEIEQVALGIATLGIAPGERVGLLCDTRREWTVASYGITSAGCVVVPVYPTNSAAECEWVLGDSGARAVIGENAAQLAKVAAVRSRLPDLDHVVLVDAAPAGPGGADGAGELTLAQLRDRGRAAGDPDRADLRARQAAVAPGDPYTIIYTSGTTGPPKGVVLTHSNLTAACRMIGELGVVQPGEVSYLFLPLAHIYAQSTMHAAFHMGTTLIYYGGDTRQILPELAATHPTYLPSVPRIFEKLYTAAMKLRAAGGPEDQARFDAAVAVGVEVRRLRERGEQVPADLAHIFELAEESLYARVRGLLGGGVTRALSAAAPIAPEILEFFSACGVLVLEAWGMTETTALGTISTPEHHRIGTVGRVWPELELQIADDGEVLIRGATIFREYWRNPEATAEAIVGGWLHTGDLGEVDGDGYLTITGRKKDIIITAGGKNLTPANLENDLKASPFISQAVIHGDRRPFAVALITLDPEEIGPWAAERGLPSDPAALAAHPEVVALVQAALDAANAQYAQVEQVKRFAILPRDLTIDDGELTPTLKVKRAIVNERYAGVLDSLYAG